MLVIPQQTAGAQPEPDELPSAVETLRTATAPYGSTEQIVTFANNGQEVVGTLTLPEVNPDQVGVVGLSQGGLVAASAAAQDDRIKSVVLWSPAANPVDT